MSQELKDELLNPVDATEHIGLTNPGTLAVWRCKRKHLPFIKVGGAVRYRKSDLDKYLYERLIK